MLMINGDIGFMRTAGIGAVLMCVFFFLPSFLPAQSAAGDTGQSRQTEAADSLKSPLGAAVRSLLVPGWGQLYNGRELKSAAVFLAEGTVMAFAIREGRRYDTHGSGRAQSARNTLLWWAFFLHAASVMDAYVDASLMRFTENMNISLNTDERMWAMTLSCTW